MCKTFNKMMSQTRYNIWEHAIYMTNYYLIKHYTGTEHDEVKMYYAEFLWAEILNYLYDKLYEDMSKRDIKDFDINKVMLQVKIDTYEQRVKWFHQWLSKKPSQEKIVQILQQLHPAYSDLKDVKQELGLIISLEDLKKKLHNE